ncbi:unnamed protein product [Mytilus edulis]|uniref:Uncharacterized protein n=1 Tax=Mytilus edulis TaxID=6550 RepID=A0A8S3PY76_MYTED|nr:unnamed protein product [Mytilus edulis]
MSGNNYDQTDHCSTEADTTQFNCQRRLGSTTTVDQNSNSEDSPNNCRTNDNIPTLKTTTGKSTTTLTEQNDNRDKLRAEQTTTPQKPRYNNAQLSAATETPTTIADQNNNSEILTTTAEPNDNRGTNYDRTDYSLRGRYSNGSNWVVDWKLNYHCRSNK